MLMKSIKFLACLAALAALGGCPQDTAAPQTLKSSDGKYSLTVQGGKFENKLAQKETIAAERLQGTPARYLTMLAEPTDNGALVYGLTMPLPANFKMTIEQVAESMKAKAGQSSLSKDAKIEPLPAKDGYGRFLLSVNNSINGTAAHEVCLVSLKKNYLIACIVTQGGTEQPWVKPALKDLGYH